MVVTSTRNNFGPQAGLIDIVHRFSHPPKLLIFRDVCWFYRATAEHRLWNPNTDESPRWPHSFFTVQGKFPNIPMNTRYRQNGDSLCTLSGNLVENWCLLLPMCLPTDVHGRTDSIKGSILTKLKWLVEMIIWDK